jgi:hypothetical protein
MFAPPIVTHNRKRRKDIQTQFCSSCDENKYYSIGVTNEFANHGTAYAKKQVWIKPTAISGRQSAVCINCCEVLPLTMTLNHTFQKHHHLNLPNTFS